MIPTPGSVARLSLQSADRFSIDENISSLSQPRCDWFGKLGFACNDFNLNGRGDYSKKAVRSSDGSAAAGWSMNLFQNGWVNSHKLSLQGARMIREWILSRNSGGMVSLVSLSKKQGIPVMWFIVPSWNLDFISDASGSRRRLYFRHTIWCFSRSTL